MTEPVVAWLDDFHGAVGDLVRRTGGDEFKNRYYRPCILARDNPDHKRLGWLQERYEAYLATLDDTEKDESYGTVKKLAEWNIGPFIAWLKENP